MTKRWDAGDGIEFFYINQGSNKLSSPHSQFHQKNWRKSSIYWKADLRGKTKPPPTHPPAQEIDNV